VRDAVPRGRIVSALFDAARWFEDAAEAARKGEVGAARGFSAWAMRALTRIAPRNEAAPGERGVLGEPSDAVVPTAQEREVR
jgi:hypothetical protein